MKRSLLLSIAFLFLVYGAAPAFAGSTTLRNTNTITNTTTIRNGRSHFGGSLGYGYSSVPASTARSVSGSSAYSVPGSSAYHAEGYDPRYARRLLQTIRPPVPKDLGANYYVLGGSLYK